MNRPRIPIKPASSETIAEAAQLIRSGRLVAFPTETVYGLGADATKGELSHSLLWCGDCSPI